jgi:HK97 gp10 family phage protein
VAEISLDGLEELVEELQKTGRAAGRAENAALRAGGEVIKNGMSKRAPRSKINKPHLADNIEVSNVKKKDAEKYIEIGPGKDFFYGQFVELGTSKMRAQPFMAPTMAEDGDKATEAMAWQLRKVL